MSSSTTEVTLEITPSSRFDVIDITEEVNERYGNLLAQYPRALYYSYHTTAGYFEQSLCADLDHNQTSLQNFIQSFQRLFPPNADYKHDRMNLRTELSEVQRKKEPRNGDSHLVFIGSGLENCVTYYNQPDVPVYFIDLDGVVINGRRQRQTTVIGYSEERVVHETQLSIPVSAHPIDSVNLTDPRLGLLDQLNEMLERYEIDKGRIDISLSPTEENTALTVNEYETLLMQHDIPEVLRNPLRFVKEKGKAVLRNPRAVPHRALDYAKYDLVRVVNKLLDKFSMSESFVERFVDKCLAVPASRYLRVKRSASLLVSNQNENKAGQIVQGTYQSPILFQWETPPSRSRTIDVTLTKFV